MTLINAFGENIYVENNVDLSYFLPHEQTFREQLDTLVQSPEYADAEAAEQRGRALTTVRDPFRSVRTLGGYYPLMSCLYPYFLNARRFVTSKPGTMTFGRSWVNYMFEGSSGASHTHNGHISLYAEMVGVFYLSAPPRSGSLVILETDIPDLTPEQVIEGGKIHIAPQPYSLVIHGKSVNHAISKHMSTEARICIIIEALIN